MRRRVLPTRSQVHRQRGPPDLRRVSRGRVQEDRLRRRARSRHAAALGKKRRARPTRARPVLREDPEGRAQAHARLPADAGHFAGPWVPSIRGVIEKHPDVITRAVAAITVEHLRCREWMDGASMRYAATGKNGWSVAITPAKAMGRALVDALKGSRDRAGVVNPANGGRLAKAAAGRAQGSRRSATFRSRMTCSRDRRMDASRNGIRRSYAARSRCLRRCSTPSRR